MNDIRHEANDTKPSGPDTPEAKRNWSDEAQVSEILKKNTGVMVCIPNLQASINTSLAIWLQSLAFKTIDINCPYFFKIHMPNDLVPIEWARNQCVREFMKDEYFKRLWFVDSDMIPPANALDLLEYDGPIVSAMTYIWAHEKFDNERYVPPHVRINGFRYQQKTDDYMSLLPNQTGDPFTCDAAGMAVTVLSREMLLRMPEPWFRGHRDPYGQLLRGEDLDFCKRANDLGYSVTYVPRIIWGHTKQVDIKQITKYGMAAVRQVVDAHKRTGKLPEIVFPGEEAATPVEQVADAPKSLEFNNRR